MLFPKIKFDFICSLGEDCACTSYLKRFLLRDASYPFDWLTKASFQTRINLVLNNFDGFMDIKNFQKLEINNSKSFDSYENIKLDLYFYHDFPKDIILNQSFSEVAEKYNRRTERFYKKINASKNILFVWWSRNKHLDNEILKQSQEQLAQKFSNTNISLLILEDDCNQPSYLFEQITPNVLKVTYQLSGGDVSITNGNETASNFIFKKIKKKGLAKIKLRKFLIRLISNLIFIKKWRKDFRKKH